MKKLYKQPQTDQVSLNANQVICVSVVDGESDNMTSDAPTRRAAVMYI